MKKWFDLLFEQEEETEIIADAPLKDISTKKTAIQENKDILKEDKEKETKKRSSSFIDLEELQVKKINNKKEIKKEEIIYETRPSISPIFGYADTDDKQINNSSIKRDSNSESLLGTIYSPYYGLMKQRPFNTKKDILTKDDLLTENQRIKQDSAKENATAIAVDIPELNIDIDEDIANIKQNNNHSLREVIDKPKNNILNEQEISLFDDLYDEDE